MAMARISLVEQYNNKDVIEQIYNLKNKMDDLEESGVIELVERVETLETSDTTKTGQIIGLTNRMSTAEDEIEDNTAAIEALEDELIAYQPINQKNTASGYAGLDANTKITNDKLYTGNQLDQLLVCGAQLLQNEILYVDSNGKIRSRAASGSTTYQGRYSSVASLPSSGVSNGDWATVYGASPQTDDGMYVYSTAITPAAWQKATLFDATDYELVSNLVTAISGSSDNSHYPSAKAVFDLHNADSVSDMISTVTMGPTTETVSLSIKSPNNTILASESFVLQKDETPTADSWSPLTSGGAYQALQLKLDATKCTFQTTAPTQAVTDGGVHIVYLTAEPDTKYNGYIYLIASSS